MIRWIALFLIAALLTASVSAAANDDREQDTQETTMVSSLCGLDDGGVMLVRCNGENVSAQCFDDKLQRIKAIRTADRVPDAAICGELGLERLALLTEEIPATIQDALRRRVHLRTETLVDFLQV